MNDVVRIGTRRSKLALAQSRIVAQQIEKASGLKTELVGITTEGDVTERSLRQIGGTGAFAAAIRKSLADGDIDLAVHSLKDLPAAPEPGLSIAAVPKRGDARDVLCTAASVQGQRALAELPKNAAIGTGSARRAVQLRAILGRAGRGDVRIEDIRGNIDTRLAKMYRGEVQGIVLAAAGLVRLGKAGEINMYFDPADMVPAAGQGALAVEMRTDLLNSMSAPGAHWRSPTAVSAEGAGDAPSHPLLKGISELDDPMTRLAVTAERAVLARLDVGCAKPVGAYAIASRGLITVQAVAAGEDDSSRSQRLFRAQGRTSDREIPRINDAGAVLAGINAAEQLIFQGVRYGEH